MLKTWRTRSTVKAYRALRKQRPALTDAPNLVGTAAF